MAAKAQKNGVIPGSGAASQLQQHKMDEIVPEPMQSKNGVSQGDAATPPRANGVNGATSGNGNAGGSPSAAGSGGAGGGGGSGGVGVRATTTGTTRPSAMKKTASTAAASAGSVAGMVRADKVDVSGLDAALERLHSRKSPHNGVGRDDGADVKAGAPAEAAGEGSAAGGVGGGVAEEKGEDDGEDGKKPEWEIDVGQLILKAKLGQGTYGTVYRGTYNGKEVAVKVLDFGTADTMSRAKMKEVRNAFRQEVAVWSKLSHPSITQFLGASVTGEKGFRIPSFIPAAKGTMRIGGHLCCVVVEFVEGGTVKDFLIKHRRSKLPLRTVVQMALDLARGLQYLHEQKVVHRDIKTENLLLGRRHRIKIADFGVARVEANNPKDMTGSTGTLGYMAPEVLDGKPYDHKADIYSFGICLWEMYCCDMPFPNLSLKEMAAVVNKGLRPVVPGICPRDLAAVMTQCWDGQPSKRPEMSEVVAMLEKVDLVKGRGMPKVQEVPTGCFCLF